MNSNLLLTLLSIHRHGSMAEAARQLNVTHGAVAQQVKLLEETLQTSLVERHGRKVHLTSSGLRIIEKSQQILDDIRSLPAIASAEEIRGRLRLGVGNTAVVSRVPEILEKIAARHPDLQIQVHLGTSAHFYPLVRSGELDAAIALEPPFGLPKEFGWQLLSEERLVLLVPARLQARPVLELLRKQPFIHYDRGTWIGQSADAYLGGLDIEPRSQFEVPSTEAIARMVHKGLGVGIVPKIPHLWSPTLNVAELALPGLGEVRRFGFVWLESSPRLPLIRALAKIVLNRPRPIPSGRA